MQNAIARRRNAAVLALVVASGAALAACGTEQATTPAGQTPVANVQPGGQAPALGPDREHLAQSPDGFTDPQARAPDPSRANRGNPPAPRIIRGIGTPPSCVPAARS